MKKKQNTTKKKTRKQRCMQLLSKNDSSYPGLKKYIYKKVFKH